MSSARDWAKHRGMPLCSRGCGKPCRFPARIASPSHGGELHYLARGARYRPPGSVIQEVIRSGATTITGALTAQLASSESRPAAVTSESRPIRLHTLSRQAVRGPVQSLKAARGIHALVPREFAERQLVRPRLWAWMPRSCRWSSLPHSQWAGTGRLVPETVAIQQASGACCGWGCRACYPAGSRPGGIHGWPWNRARRASSLLMSHLMAVDR